MTMSDDLARNDATNAKDAAQVSSAWEDRRKALLHEACTRIEEWVRNGVPISRAIANAARKYGGADLGGGYRLMRSSRQFRRYWCLWQKTRNASAFPPRYHAGKRTKPDKPDPLLLRLIYEHCLQTGDSLSQTIQALRKKGVHISMRDMRAALSPRALNRFARSHKQLAKHRTRLETRFLRSIARANRRFLKKQTALHARFFERDERLHLRLLRDREQLQKKFLAADARAVKKREELQRKLLGRIGA